MNSIFVHINEWLPPFLVVALMCALHEFHFEAQRWARQIEQGKRGSNELATAFVLFTNVFAVVAELGVLGFLAWFAGWKIAVGLYIFKFLFSLIWGVTVGLFYRDQFAIWLISVLAIWPTAAYLGYTVYHLYS